MGIFHNDNLSLIVLQPPLRSCVMPRKKSQGYARYVGGMTLIEVLVAMLILSITLVASLRTVGSATSNQMVLRDRLLAEWAGRQVLSERRIGIRPWRDSGENQGELTLNGRLFVYQENITYVPGSNPDFRLLQLSIALKDKPDAVLFRAVDFARRPY